MSSQHARIENHSHAPQERNLYDWHQKKQEHITDQRQLHHTKDHQ